MKRTHPYRRAYGRVIRKLRRERRFSQQDLANLVFCDRGMIGNYERAENSPTLDMIARIAEELQISLAELFRLVEEDRLLRAYNRKFHRENGQGRPVSTQCLP